MDLAVSFVMILFALNPVGKASALISHLHRLAPARRRLIVIRELLLGLVIMMAFLAAAALLLQHLGSNPLLVTAGGAVLMLMRLRRIAFGSGIIPEVPTEREPPLYPLALPYIAGPAVLAAELLRVARDPGRGAVWGTGSYLAWVPRASRTRCKLRNDVSSAATPGNDTSSVGTWGPAEFPPVWRTAVHEDQRGLSSPKDS